MTKTRLLFGSMMVAVLFAGACNAAPASKKVSPGDTVTLTLPGDVKLEVVSIPAGSFRMGSPESERGRYADEGPVHKVTIDYDFCIGKYEVTQAQWMSVMDKNPAYRYGIGDDFPVSHVSWNMCQQFIAKLNRLGLGTFRLPSEAEWEYACRAGSQDRFYFGDSLDGSDTCDDCKVGSLSGNRTEYMWYCGNNGVVGTPQFGAKPVGRSKPNAFGLYDMHGNIWELCLDQYHPNYKGAPTDGRLWQDWGGAPRVLRGGGWDYHVRNCRAAVRCGYSADRGYTFHGLRLVWFPFERKSQEWFKTWEAEVIGDNIVSYQSDIGAWPKNMRMESHGYQGEKFTKNWGTSIDNGATIREMDYLAQLYWTGGKKRFKASFNKALDWLFEAQYDNGGWPQRYPLTHDADYGDYITFNDDAMVNVLRLLDKVLKKSDSDLLTVKRQKLAKRAYDKGLQCVLDCQVVIDGKPSVWGQQHDPVTLIPRPGREYEPASVCGRESVGVLTFLMSIENPSDRIVESIEAAAAWFEASKITGYRLEGRKGLVKDPDAPPMWARFYEIESGRPIFGTYDGKVEYDFAKILKQRSPGYQWYSQAGDQALKEYAQWKANRAQK